jgi:zinc protease
MTACFWPLIALAALLQAPAKPAPAVTEFALPTGVRAALRHEPGAGAAAICAMVAGGAEADPEGSRLADLTTRCLFGDNQNLSKAAVWRAVYAAGGDLSCTWSEQGVAISCVTTPDRFEDALYVIAQALKNAEMDVESVAAAKRAIGVSLRAEAANPDAVAGAAARQALFPNSPYGKPRIQADAALRRLTRADVLRCYQTWFRPERCSIAVVGDVTAARARRALENYFVDFERQPVPRQPVAEAKPSSGPARQAIAMRSGTSLVMTLLPAPAPASDDFAAALTLAALLGGGRGAGCSASYARLRASATRWAPSAGGKPRETISWPVWRRRRPKQHGRRRYWTAWWRASSRVRPARPNWSVQGASPRGPTAWHTNGCATGPTIWRSGPVRRWGRRPMTRWQRGSPR